jgi:hypothetical protein
MKDFSKILENTRRTGYTTYLLRSAIFDPEVVILSPTKEASKRLESLYDFIKKEVYKEYTSKFPFINFLLKIKHFFVSDPLRRKLSKRPMFIAYSELNKLKGIHRPVIYDNACFYIY